MFSPYMSVLLEISVRLCYLYICKGNVFLTIRKTFVVFGLRFKIKSEVFGFTLRTDYGWLLDSSSDFFTTVTLFIK